MFLLSESLRGRLERKRQNERESEGGVREVCETENDRQSVRERKRETDRHTERQTDRQTVSEREE